MARPGMERPADNRMQPTKLRAAPVRQAEVPACALAGMMDGGTASRLIRRGCPDPGWSSLCRSHLVSGESAGARSRASSPPGRVDLEEVGDGHVRRILRAPVTRSARQEADSSRTRRRCEG
jgi:hypothetical protein